MLGFGALGEFALGEGPVETNLVVGGRFSEPLRKKSLTVAVIATTFVGFVAPPQPAQANTFAQFSQPLNRVNKALHISWLNTPAPFSQFTALFDTFSQPVKSRYTVFDESQSVFYPPEEPPAPPFTGFSRFEGVIKARLNIAPFSEFRQFYFIPPPDTHDGVFVKRKHKRYGPDPIELEIQERQRRRAALELAVYGPEVEITAEIPVVESVAATPPPNIEDIARIMMAAQQAQAERAKQAELEADEDDLESILREIL